MSAFEYREYNRGVYGVELPLDNPWTSKAGVVATVMELLAASIDMVESSTYDVTHNRLEEVKSQLPALASVVFECLNERLEWLRR